MGNDDPETSSRSSLMRPPPVPTSCVPLMTPSASPPVQRPFGRQFDGPSPTKKRRLSRTPSLLGPAARSYSRGSTSSSSVQPPAFSRVGTPLDSNEDLHSARRASSFKVLNVWSNLADKYARRLDEDDIVDLENETIIKDYGVLSSSDDMYEIGCFADQHELEDRQSEEELLIAADDEPDELDAFNEVSESGDRDVDLKFSGQPKRLPPVRELDPADAADLAEFLEAEKTRKEKFGDLGEEEEDREEDENEDEERRVVGDEDEEFTEDSTAGYRSGTEIDGNGRDSGDSEEEETYEENVRDEDDSLRGHTDYRRVFTPSGSPEFDILGLTVRGGGEENSEEAKEQENASVLAEDDTLQVVTEDPLSPASDEGSEDELGAWEQDEGNTLYSLDNLDDNDSDVDNIGTDDFDDGPVILEEPVSANEYTQSPTPTLKSPRVPRTDKTKGKERAVKSDQSDWMLLESASSATSASPATVFQLQTPPRSSSFGPEARVAKPVATYSRKRRGSSKKTPLRITSTSTEDLHSEAVDTSLPRSRSTMEQRQKAQSRSRQSSVSSTKRYQLVPEVVINVPAQSIFRTFSGAEPELDNSADDLPEQPDVFVPLKSSKGKDKAKAFQVDDYVDNDTAHNRTKSTKSKASARSVPVSSDDPQDYQESASKRSSSGRKRRRAYSPVIDQYGEHDRVEAAKIYSPPPTQKPAKHLKSSRRSAINYNTREEQEAGPSLQSSRRRSHPRPVANDPSCNDTSRPPSHASHNEHPFSFPFPSVYPTLPEFQHCGTQSAPSYPHHQHTGPLPNFQDPSAQYHLAQALQSLSVLMGGAFPFKPSSLHGAHTPHPFPTVQSPGNPHYPWPPYTPRHCNDYPDVLTPQSAASAPPTSSPVGSNYSDSLPSSPIKQHTELNRSRSRSISRGRSGVRPRSAIRGSSAPSRSRSLVQRRVSFSSPEAIHIEDVIRDDNPLQTSSAEDSDDDTGDADGRPNQSRTLRSRAHTPGPPGGRLAHNDIDIFPSVRNDSGPKTAASISSRRRSRTPRSKKIISLEVPK